MNYLKYNEFQRNDPLFKADVWDKVLISPFNKRVDNLSNNIRIFDMKKFIDLSVALEEGITSDPDFMLPKINYYRHKETAEEIIQFFPGLKKEDLPNEEGWAMETIKC